MQNNDSLGLQIDSGQMLLHALSTRFSLGPKHLGLPAPGHQELEWAAAVAKRAPDHGLLRPFRFVVIESDQRQRLGELFAQDAQLRGQEPAKVERARERAENGPALIALVVRIVPELEDIAEHEQWLCAGAGLMNFLNGLHLQGFAAKVLSGPSVRGAATVSSFCEADESLVAWILAGTPLKTPVQRTSPNDRTILTSWR